MKATIRLLILASLLGGGCGGGDELRGGSGLLEADEAIISAETSGRVLSLAFD